MEANDLFVVYRQPGPKEEEATAAFAAAVRELGSAIPLAPGVWLLKSDRTGSEAFPELVRQAKPGGNLVLIDSTNNAYLTWPESLGPVPGGPTS